MNLSGHLNTSEKPGQASHICRPEFKIRYQCSREVPQFTLCCFLWVADKKTVQSPQYVNKMCRAVKYSNDRKNYFMQDTVSAVFPVKCLK